jgi:hypothetical protein
MRISTEEEILKVSQAVIKGSGGTLDENRVIGAVQWAQQARVQAELLAGVLEGRYLIDLSGAEPAFRLAGQPTVVAGEG